MRISYWSSDVCSSDLAAEEQGVMPRREALGPSGDLRLQVERVLHAAGQVAQGFDVFGFLVFGQPAAQLGQRRAQGEQRHQLGGEGLGGGDADLRSEEHTSELQSLMRISYAVLCLKKK